MALGHEFMMELSAYLEADVNRVPAYGESAWMMFAGKAPSGQSFQKVKMGEFEAYEYKLEDDDCPFCRNISFPRRFCQFPAGAFQGATQTWSTLTHDGGYHGVCRETKCKAVGDPHCELTVLLVPKDMPIELVKELRPDMFEDVKTGYADY